MSVDGSKADIRERHIRQRVDDALEDTRVVVVQGARQVGKSTLVQQIAQSRDGLTSRTFDDQATRRAAADDPTGFIADLPTPVALDEVQRVPDVLLAIKQRVDGVRTPGQFLLTGSSNILTSPAISDALTGRTELIRMHPFSQGELEGRRETFIDALFGGSFPQLAEQPIGRSAYAQRIAAGGYPEAVARASTRRARFFASYLTSSMERDLRDVSSLSGGANVRRMLDALAALSGSELNFQSLSRDLGLANNTLRAYAHLLEALFLITRIPAWSNNLLARTIKAPKSYISDTGMLAYLTGADERRISSAPDVAGSFFETFAVMELVRQSSFLEDPPRFFHYRDRDRREVDLVMERRDGAVVAIEVKSAASIHSRDLSGMRLLREKLGDKFVAGAVLYTGAQTVPLGDRMAAVPLSGLWSP